MAGIDARIIFSSEARVEYSIAFDETGQKELPFHSVHLSVTNNINDVFISGSIFDRLVFLVSCGADRRGRLESLVVYSILDCGEWTADLRDDSVFTYLVCICVLA